MGARFSAGGRPSVKPPTRIPSLAQRSHELCALGLPNADVRLNAGRDLRFRFSLTAGAFGRTYRCELRIKSDRKARPEMFVLDPDLDLLAKGKALPHIYPSNASGVKLCLWLPDKREWMVSMPLGETYIAWTAEWLLYFELWLATGTWSGGGVHPQAVKKKRWA